MQAKVLDLSKPKLTTAEVQLWCGAFMHDTDLRRKNTLSLTNPDVIHMLGGAKRFDEYEFESLFGRSVLNRMHQEPPVEDFHRQTAR